jgi:hypothetical protein
MVRQPDVLSHRYDLAAVCGSLTWREDSS